MLTYSDSVALRPLGVATISKSPPVVLDFQGPAQTLKIGAVTQKIVTLTDFSMTEGGIVGNAGPAVSMVASVILESSAVTIRLFGRDGWRATLISI